MRQPIVGVRSTQGESEGGDGPVDTLGPRSTGRWPTAGIGSLCSGARARATLTRADSRKDPSSHNYQRLFTMGENVLYTIPFVRLIVLIAYL